jgi:ferric-dicitrate binding protein FerR (iron transport regulator)
MEKNKNYWGDKEIPFTKTEEQAWTELQARIQTLNNETPVRSIKPWVWVASAAAVAALVVSLFFINPEAQQFAFATGNKESKEITLPDGSTAMLNAGSSISFSNDWSEERVLNLEGEAFFSVNKGCRFKVFTKYGEVQVLGTSFNVSARPENFDVICETGRVLVKSGSEEVIITPGLQASLENGKLVKSDASHKGNSWIEGQFIFEEEPLENVISEIERQFNVSIQHPEINGKKYSGQFGNLNLEETLTVVCAPFGLDFSIGEDMKVTLKEIH